MVAGSSTAIGQGSGNQNVWIRLLLALCGLGEGKVDLLSLWPNDARLLRPELELMFKLGTTSSNMRKETLQASLSSSMAVVVLRSTSVQVHIILCSMQTLQKTLDQELAMEETTTLLDSGFTAPCNLQHSGVE